VANSFETLRDLATGIRYHSLNALGEKLGVNLRRMPVSLKILLENLVRHEDGVTVDADDIATLARWPAGDSLTREVAFHPVRVLMPDSSGVPLLIDLASMRDAMVARGLDPRRVDPMVPTDLVIDHSVRVDHAGSRDALARNLALELERNKERYGVVRWAMSQFKNLRVVPPGNGILHQINIEYFAQVVATAATPDGVLAFPDSLVGMDSHTPMVKTAWAYSAGAWAASRP
jgi:aconitate hydratase